MTRARNNRRKARKLDPEGYALRALKIRAAKLKMALMIFRGMPEKKAQTLAIDIVRDKRKRMGLA
jgi:hypothetical protein